MLAGERLDDHLFGGRLGREAGVLLDIPDPDPLAQRELSMVGLEAPGENAKQGGLPRTVGPDEPHPVALKEAERKVLEQRPRPELVRDAFTREEERAGTGTDGHRPFSRETDPGADRLSLVELRRHPPVGLAERDAFGHDQAVGLFRGEELRGEISGCR